MPRSAVDRAVPATAAVFFLTGLVMATWAARIPVVQDRLDLSPGELGLAILAIEGGAVLGLGAGGALVARVGSRACLRAAFPIFAPLLCATAAAPTLAALCGVLAVWAAANSVIDVAMNAQGIEVERRRERPVLSRLHAGHSFGVLAGGLLATIASAADVGLGAHCVAVAAVAAAGALVATHRLLRERGARGSGAMARPDRRLVLLGLVAFCIFLVDGGATNWAAVHLRDERDASAVLAAVGFTAFALAVALVRLVGDAALARLGRVRVVRVGASIATVGALVAVTGPSVALAIAGWALVGAGVAALAPAVLGAAPGMSAAPPAVAIASVTTLGYLGSFTGPPAIGALAEAFGLSAALGLVAVAAATAALLARRGLERA